MLVFIRALPKLVVNVGQTRSEIFLLVLHSVQRYLLDVIYTLRKEEEERQIF